MPQQSYRITTIVSMQFRKYLGKTEIIPEKKENSDSHRPILLKMFSICSCVIGELALRRAVLECWAGKLGRHVCQGKAFLARLDHRDDGEQQLECVFNSTVAWILYQMWEQRGGSKVGGLCSLEL